MIDTIVGIILLLIGIVWLIYQIKKPVKPNNVIKNPMNWVTNFQGYAGSILTIFLGIMLLLELASITTLF